MLLVFLLSCLVADTLTLRDGTQYTGELVSATKTRIVFNTDSGTRRQFRTSNVQAIQFGTEDASADRRQPAAPRIGTSRWPTGEIERKAAELGRNFTGSAVSPELDTEDGRGRVRVYEDATIYWTPKTGAHEVHGGIREEYLRQGGAMGKLGYPTSDEQATPDGRERFATFEHGRITWSQERGARVEFR